MRAYPHSRALGFVEMLLLLVVAVFVIHLVQAVERRSELAKEMETQSRATQLATAIRNYEAEYNAPPPAADNAGFVRVLTRDNPRGVSYLGPASGELNAKGEMVDAWGRPFEVSVGRNAQPAVISPTMLHARQRHIGASALYRPVINDAR